MVDGLWLSVVEGEKKVASRKKIRSSKFCALGPLTYTRLASWWWTPAPAMLYYIPTTTPTTT